LHEPDAPEAIDQTARISDLINMTRKLFTVVALFSLLLCAATVWWWTSSGGRIDQVTYERHGVQTVNFWGSGGKVMVTRTVYGEKASDSRRQISFDSVPLDSGSTVANSDSTLMTVAYNTQPLNGAKVSTLVMPAWLIAGVFSIFPALWMATKLKSKPKKKPQ
jgi:hypothetical protein